MGKLLTMKETAEILRKSEKALAWQVHKGQAPPSAVIGGRRLFDEELLKAWVAKKFELASA